MSEGPTRKRSFAEDGDDLNKQPPQKRVRFPKGKKVKTEDYVVDNQHGEDVPNGIGDPRLAAKQRAMRRNQITADLLDEGNREMLHDISRAEVQYENDETFVDDGFPIEPFNLTKEREEGYFDANGNYVEYINDEIKDAWLDSIDANKKNFAARPLVEPNNEDDVRDLSSEDIGKIKRRIADALEPGETVLQALRRLKGTSNNKKEKMSAETKQLFDQLTEDAMLLMENGDYDVYHEDQAAFLREAERYEKLAEARRHGTSADPGPKKSDSLFDEDSTLNGLDIERTVMGSVASELNSSATADNGADSYDMFAEDDENTAENPVLNRNDRDPNVSSRPSESTDLQNDYVYDDSSGYYYSSTLGYYYDPSSGLYCFAASGQWYSYNEESGTYDEVQQAASALS